jgi:hypothetical protein
VLNAIVDAFNRGLFGWREQTHARPAECNARNVPSLDYHFSSLKIDLIVKVYELKRRLCG